MAPATEPDFDRLAADWQTLDAPGPAPDAIQRYVRSRTRALKILAGGELLVGVVAIGALIRLAIAATSSGDRFAMLSLLAVAAVAVVASWLNWRGVLHATARNTAEFVELSRRRLRRMRQAHAAGWALLLIEVAVLAIWIADRSNPGDPRSTVFAWGLLAGLTTLAVAFLLVFRRWVVRDEHRLAELRKQLDE
jgi:hypothetical protein